MTSFHDLLVRYINERKVAVARMAEYCGLERSSLYRILRGQRTPANEELVRQMAAYLCLNPAEEDDLLLAYRVELIGYEKYSRRQFIDDFIHQDIFQRGRLRMFQTGRRQYPHVHPSGSRVYEHSDPCCR